MEEVGALMTTTAYKGATTNEDRMAMNISGVSRKTSGERRRSPGGQVTTNSKFGHRLSPKNVEPPLDFGNSIIYKVVRPNTITKSE